MPNPTVTVPLNGVKLDGNRLKVELSVTSVEGNKTWSQYAWQGVQGIATVGGASKAISDFAGTSLGQSAIQTSAKALRPAAKLAQIGVVGGHLAPGLLASTVGLGAAAFAAGGVVGHYGGKYLGDKMGGWAADLMGYGDVKLKPFTPKKGAVAEQIVKQEVEAIKQQTIATKDLTQEKLHQQEVVESISAAQEDQLDGERLLQESQSSLFDAATEGLKVYGDNAADVSGKMRNLFTDTFQSIEDRLTQFVLKGRLSFSGLAESIKESLAQMAVGNLIMSPMRELV